MASTTKSTRSTTSRRASSKLEEAEVAKLAAERSFYEANARVAAALAQQEEVALRVRERAEADVLTRDEYNNVYVLDTDIDDDSVRECMQTLISWARRDPGCAIEIQLNTTGGSMFAGLSLIDFIRDLRKRGHEITIVVYGHAASMGAVILQAADRRIIGECSMLLCHEGSMFAGGDAGQIEDEVKLFKKLQDRMLTLLASRAKISKQTIKNRWRRTDWWLTAEEALEVGFVDEIR